MIYADRWTKAGRGGYDRMTPYGVWV